MSDLTGKFAALEEQLEAADAAMQVDLNAMREELSLLNAQIDTLNINGAANTRAILAALAANSPCAPCPTPSLVVPPVDSVFTPINADKCKRSQAFVHALLEMATATDVISAFSVPFSPQLILDAVDQVITSLANGDPTPVMTWAEASNFVNQAITYAAGNLFVGNTLVEFISELAFDIRDATYSAGSASAAKAAYEGVIDGSSVPGYAKGLLKALAWNELYSFYFDPESDINLTGYDGDACSAPTGCVTLLEDHSFVITKTDDDGLDYVQFDIPSWAATLEWNITFSEGFNVFWSATERETGDPFTGFINSTGFTGTQTDLWDEAHSGVTYFGVGGFFAGFPNGHTVNVTINSLIACPEEV